MCMPLDINANSSDTLESTKVMSIENFNGLRRFGTECNPARFT